MGTTESHYNIDSGSLELSGLCFKLCITPYADLVLIIPENPEFILFYTHFSLS
jgi:hypothetical protein